MKKNVRFGPTAVGTNSLLATYAILCLVIFALLSLNTVLAQKRLAEAGVQAVSRYYEADYQAEMILARLRSGEIVAGVDFHEDIYRYECVISEAQTLMVEVKCQQGEWEVLRWQTVIQE